MPGGGCPLQVSLAGTAGELSILSQELKGENQAQGMFLNQFITQSKL